jgi:hypothetical protein
MARLGILADSVKKKATSNARDHTEWIRNDVN